MSDSKVYADTAQADHSLPRPSDKKMFWLVLLAIALLAANMRSPIVALGSVAHVVQANLGINETQIGWLGALPMLMFALGALVSPALGKRYGLENTLIVMIVVLTIGIIIRSVFVSWYGFLFGTLLLSLAIGFANTLAAPIIKQRTPKHIALITGIYSLTMTLMAGLSAGLVLPLSQHFGWQWALGGWAILGIIAIIIWLLLKIHLVHESRQLMAKPNDGSAKSNMAHSQMQTSGTSQLASSSFSIWKAPLAWYIAIFLGLQSLLFYTVASFLPSIWLNKGLSDISAGQMGAIFQFMAPVVILSLTWLVNRGRSMQTMAVILALFNVIGVAGMAFLSTQLAWLWSAFMGLGCAGIFTLCVMLFSLRTHTIQQASELSGMSQTIGYIIAFFGPLGAGWLHDKTQGWQIPLIILLVLMVINVIFAWYASRPIMIGDDKS